jgi:hypothetical protein
MINFRTNPIRPGTNKHVFLKPELINKLKEGYSLVIYRISQENDLVYIPEIRHGKILEWMISVNMVLYSVIG